MPYKTIPFILLLSMKAIQAVETIELSAINPNHPERYVVAPKDTLWDIAARFLIHPWRWNDLWRINQHIQNPHLIYPGDVITLQIIDGQVAPEIIRGGETVKLSPKIRETKLVSAIPIIPLDAIHSFLIRARVTTEEELIQAPYIISQSDQRVIASVSDHIYVRGIISDETTLYGIYRAGRPYYRNSERGKQILLGIEAIPLGEAKLIRMGDPATLLVTQSSHEIIAGDRLLLEEKRTFTQNFIPHPPDFPIEAQIIDVVDGSSHFGRLHIVVLDRGKNDGLEIGHVLVIDQRGKVVTDPITQEPITLPQETAGALMIFRPFDQLSYALVLEAQREMQVLDIARTP